MDKPKLFLDFDDTIVNSSKAICDIYNMLYKDYNGFKPADWTKNVTWDFKDECPLMSQQDKTNLFRSKIFWDNVKLFPDAYNALLALSAKYRIIIVSLGTLKNLSYKALFLKEKLPFIDDVILLKNSGTKMDKSFINMSGGIFIDDVLSNIESSNADKKYVFGKISDYNRTDKYGRLLDWKEVWMELMLDE
jgi:5'(3')-deoxyribonucleotidase